MALYSLYYVRVLGNCSDSFHSRPRAQFTDDQDNFKTAFRLSIFLQQLVN